MTGGLAASLPGTFYSGLTRYGVPSAAASKIAHLPPTAALFGAFLGYNPIAQLLPPPVLAHILPANQNILLGKKFFPNLISTPFMDGLHAVFYISAALCIVAAVVSLLRGRHVPHAEVQLAMGAVASGSAMNGQVAETSSVATPEWGTPEEHEARSGAAKEEALG